MFQKRKNDAISENINNSQKKRYKTFVLAVCVVLCMTAVFYGGKFMVIQAQAALGYLSENTIDIVSDTFGKAMQTDVYGNVNILLVGIGGENHDGGMLADAIIVASRNPKLKAVTMISIPRDLYIDVPIHNTQGRINQVFSTAYYRNDRSLHEAAKVLAAEIEEITSINPTYYAVVDFAGFKNIIDMVGGITIDVPERIYDTTYPNDANRGYTTFHIERGIHHIDGDTALKYARSRHSSSDFARSVRQQQIIEATIKEILRKENIQNVATIKSLYDQYIKMVTTNISNKEIVGVIKYVFSLEHIFNFGLTSTCSNRGRQLMQVGCFLYTPNRDRFSGASVLLTNGSTYNNFSFYDYTRNFGHIVAQNQRFLIENPRIKIQNGIDKSYAQQAKKGTDGHATQVAVKLKKYGFSIVGAENASETQTGTIAIIYGNEKYLHTLAVLKKFFPIDEIRYVDPVFDDLGEPTTTEQDMVIILGNSYIDTRSPQFNYNM